MKNSTTKPISEILQNSALTRIVQRVNELNQMNVKIQRLLPSIYHRLYRIVNLSDNQLVFEVPNASIRQGLLLQQATLLKLIQAEFPQVSELKVKVNPNFKPF